MTTRVNRAVAEVLVGDRRRRRPSAPSASAGSARPAGGSSFGPPEVGNDDDVPIRTPMVARVWRCAPRRRASRRVHPSSDAGLARPDGVQLAYGRDGRQARGGAGRDRSGAGTAVRAFRRASTRVATTCASWSTGGAASGAGPPTRAACRATARRTPRGRALARLPSRLTERRAPFWRRPRGRRRLPPQALPLPPPLVLTLGALRIYSGHPHTRTFAVEVAVYVPDG